MTRHVYTVRTRGERINMVYAMDKNRRTLEKFRLSALVAELVNRLAADCVGVARVAYEDLVNSGSGKHAVHIYLTPSEPACDHEWNNGGENPTHCVKCGYSFERYVHGMF